MLDIVWRRFEKESWWSVSDEDELLLYSSVLTREILV